MDSQDRQASERQSVGISQSLTNLPPHRTIHLCMCVSVCVRWGGRARTFAHRDLPQSCGYTFPTTSLPFPATRMNSTISAQHSLISALKARIAFNEAFFVKFLCGFVSEIMDMNGYFAKAWREGYFKYPLKSYIYKRF